MDRILTRPPTTRGVCTWCSREDQPLIARRNTILDDRLHERVCVTCVREHVAVDHTGAEVWVDQRYLCEAGNTTPRAGVLYRYVVDPKCKSCRKIAAVYA